MKITGANLLRTLLERQGIRTVAGIPGGAILPFYDALHRSPIRHILTRHEQGAGFIAQGMARVTGKAAVCVATSGPGATNLLTAIADARLDSVPLVAITGQVARSLIGTDAFQEVDTYGLTLPVTKHNFLVRHPAELLEVVPLAFQLAESGRPGPVAIDVPKDVQNAAADVEDWPDPGRPVPAPACADELIGELARLLLAARRPVLYLGGGVTTENRSRQPSGRTDLLCQFIGHKRSIPGNGNDRGTDHVAGRTVRRDEYDVRGHQPADKRYRRPASSRIQTLADPRVFSAGIIGTRSGRRCVRMCHRFVMRWLDSEQYRYRRAWRRVGKFVVLRLTVDASTIAVGMMMALAMGFFGGLIPSIGPPCDAAL